MNKNKKNLIIIKRDALPVEPKKLLERMALEVRALVSKLPKKRPS